jgi:hypothetical protein
VRVVVFGVKTDGTGSGGELLAGECFGLGGSSGGGVGDGEEGKHGSEDLPEHGKEIEFRRMEAMKRTGGEERGRHAQRSLF